MFYMFQNCTLPEVEMDDWVANFLCKAHVLYYYLLMMLVVISVALISFCLIIAAIVQLCANKTIKSRK